MNRQVLKRSPFLFDDIKAQLILSPPRWGHLFASGSPSHLTGWCAKTGRQNKQIKQEMLLCPCSGNYNLTWRLSTDTVLNSQYRHESIVESIEGHRSPKGCPNFVPTSENPASSQRVFHVFVPRTTLQVSSREYVDIVDIHEARYSNTNIHDGNFSN